MTNMFVAGIKIAERNFGKFGNKLEQFVKDGVVTSVIDVSKKHPVNKNYGLYQIVKKHDAQTGALKRLQLGFSSPDTLSLDCAVLDSAKHDIGKIMKDLNLLKKDGASPDTIVEYLDIWFN